MLSFPVSVVRPPDPIPENSPDHQPDHHGDFTANQSGRFAEVAETQPTDQEAGEHKGAEEQVTDATGQDASGAAPPKLLLESPPRERI